MTEPYWELLAAWQSIVEGVSGPVARETVRFCVCGGVCARMFMCVHLCLWACECLWRSEVNAGFLSQSLPPHVSVLWFDIESFTLNWCSSSLVNLVCTRLTKKTLTGHLLNLELPDWTGVTYMHPVCSFICFLTWMLKRSKLRLSSLYGEHFTVWNIFLALLVHFWKVFGDVFYEEGNALYHRAMTIRAAHPHPHPAL